MKFLLSGMGWEERNERERNEGAGKTWALLCRQRDSVFGQPQKRPSWRLRANWVLDQKLEKLASVGDCEDKYQDATAPLAGFLTTFNCNDVLGVPLASRLESQLPLHKMSDCSFSWLMPRGLT